MTCRSILQIGEGAKQEGIVLERSAILNLDPGRGDGVRGVRAMRAMRAMRRKVFGVFLTLYYVLRRILLKKQAIFIQLLESPIPL